MKKNIFLKNSSYIINSVNICQPLGVLSVENVVNVVTCQWGGRLKMLLIERWMSTYRSFLSHYLFIPFTDMQMHNNKSVISFLHYFHSSTHQKVLTITQHCTYAKCFEKRQQILMLFGYQHSPEYVLFGSAKERKSYRLGKT